MCHGSALRAIRRIIAILAISRRIVSICGRIGAVVAFCGWIVFTGGRRRCLIAINGRRIGVRRRGRLVAINRWRIGVRGGRRIVALRRRIVSIRCRIAITPVLALPIADFLNRCCHGVGAMEAGQT